MKTIKIAAVVVLIYVGIVVVFESLLGYFQPSGGGTLVLTTTDEQHNERERVLSRIESQGKLYVAANHWPRAWYNEVLANPQVQVTLDGEKGAYVALPATDEEYARLNAERPLGIGIRILTGFPPREFVRLDPR